MISHHDDSLPRAARSTARRGGVHTPRRASYRTDAEVKRLREVEQIARRAEAALQERVRSLGLWRDVGAPRGVGTTAAARDVEDAARYFYEEYDDHFAVYGEDSE